LVAVPVWMGDVFERARAHLEADVVYFVEFVEGEAIVHPVAGDPAPFGLDQGVRVEAQRSFAALVAEAQAPVVLGDTAGGAPDGPLPFITTNAPGALVGAPVRLANGQVFGVLVAAFAAPRADLGPAEADVLGFMAGIVVTELGRLRDERHLESELRERIRGVIATEAMRSVFQPIVSITGRRTVGVEALTRFDSEPQRSPTLWFAEAHRVGMGTDLEIAAVRAALRAATELPDHLYLSMNASPVTLVEGAFHEELAALDPSRIVIEITEHAAVTSYRQVSDALAEVRESGVRLAIDDLGSGFAGFSHLTGLQPDVIKLDGSIVRAAPTDAYYHSLLVGMTSFAEGVGASTIGEGVESPDHLRVLMDAGIDAAQGYLFARPGPPASIHAVYPAVIDVDSALEDAGAPPPPPAGPPGPPPRPPVAGAARAGANVLVAGSALFRDSRGLEHAVSELRQLARATQPAQGE
jgi:EAL domain-containing protein (putative c-di-GMP-specific phosphodiesterase class I)